VVQLLHPLTGAPTKPKQKQESVRLGKEDKTEGHVGGKNPI